MSLFLKFWNKKTVRILIIIMLSFLAIISVGRGAINAIEYSQDFQWDAAKAYALGINPYDLSLNPEMAKGVPKLQEFYAIFENAGLKQKMEANQFPSLLLLLVPFTFLDPMAARYVWLVFNILLTGLMMLLLKETFFKAFSLEGRIALFLLMLAGTPFRNQIGVGQHTIFAFTFFLLAVYFSEKKRGMLPTILCLFVCYFKYTLTVPLVLYFVYKKKYIEIIVSAAIHVVLTFVSALWLKDTFLNMIIEPLKVSSALSAEGGLDFGALLNGSKLAFVLAAIVMLVLLIMCFALPEGMDNQVISVLALWSLIITYHRTYDFFVLIIVSACFTGKSGIRLLTEKGRSIGNIVVMLYSLSVAGVFFALRVFDEAVYAKIIVGAVYYALTVLITYLVYKTGKEKDK